MSLACSCLLPFDVRPLRPSFCFCQCSATPPRHWTRLHYSGPLSSESVTRGEIEMRGDAKVQHLMISVMGLRGWTNSLGQTPGSASCLVMIQYHGAREPVLSDQVYRVICDVDCSPLTLILRVVACRTGLCQCLLPLVDKSLHKERVLPFNCVRSSMLRHRHGRPFIIVSYPHRRNALISSQCVH